MRQTLLAVLLTSLGAAAAAEPSNGGALLAFQNVEHPYHGKHSAAKQAPAPKPPAAPAPEISTATAVAVEPEASTAAAHEMPGRLDRPWRYFFAFDYFLSDNGGKGLKDQLRTKATFLGAQGYSGTDFSVNTQGAVGARIGVLRTLPHKLELGFSAGYLLGPNTSSNFTAIGGPGPGGLTINRDVLYVRELIQFQRAQPVTKRLSFVVGGSVGLATGRVQQGCQSSGTLTCPFATETHTWTGLSYEVMTSLRYRTGKLIDLRFGPRFAGFPTYNGNNNSGRIEYQPFGFFFGAIF